MGKSGGVSYASTDAMEDRFRPWCNAILRPGEENFPVHFAGAQGAPVRFVDVNVHMLWMMNYVSFHDVIGIPPTPFKLSYSRARSRELHGNTFSLQNPVACHACRL
jgi:hypothetical protein